MNYTLHQLKIFLTICETESITKAAEILHLTQPAVSIQLKNLQAQFEFPLTEVVRRKLYITDFGVEIAETCKRILNEAEAINQKIQIYKGQISGTLKISVVSTGKYVMPYFLTQFLNENPGVELKMDVTNKYSVVESLEKNQVDFSLVSILPEKTPLSTIDLMANKLYLVGNPDHPYFLEKKQPLKYLKGIDLIFREAGSGTRQTLERFFQQKQLQIQKKMELTSNEAVKQAVVAGLGFAIMPLIGIKNELQNGDLRIIPMDDFPLTSTWQLTWPTSKKHSPAAKAFLDFVEKNKDEIIQKHFYWYANT